MFQQLHRSPFLSFCETLKQVCERSAYLDGDGQGGGAEVFLHNAAHPLRGAEQIRQLVRPQVTETLDRPYGTH